MEIAKKYGIRALLVFLTVAMLGLLAYQRKMKKQLRGNLPYGNARSSVVSRAASRAINETNNRPDNRPDTTSAKVIAITSYNLLLCGNSDKNKKKNARLLWNVFHDCFPRPSGAYFYQQE